LRLGISDEGRYGPGVGSGGGNRHEDGRGCRRGRRRGACSAAGPGGRCHWLCWRRRRRRRRDGSVAIWVAGCAGKEMCMSTVCFREGWRAKRGHEERKNTCNS
jgi:hypothetical protein